MARREQQPVLAIPRTRPRLTGPVVLKLVARLPEPDAPSVVVGQEPLDREIDLSALASSITVSRVLSSSAFRSANRRFASARRPWDLLLCEAARAAHPRASRHRAIRATAGVLRLTQDLRDQLAVGAVAVHRRVRVIFVPSIVITPIDPEPVL